MKHLYYIEPEILVATKQERCQGYACYNKIEPNQVYYIVTTDIANNGVNVRQNLCVKCIQKWFEGNIKRLKGEILDNSNNLGKVEGLAIKYYGEI